MPSKANFGEIEVRLFSQLRDRGFAPVVVYDVGAAHGAWSGQVSAVFHSARFELFDPLAGERKDYGDFYDTYLRGSDRFRIHAVGLGDENRQADMSMFNDGVSSSFHLVTDPANVEQRSFPIRRLDDFALENGLAPPDLIKVDTQGFEHKVIEGGRQAFSHARVVQLETWLVREYDGQTPVLTETIDLMRGLGFILVELGDMYYGADHQLFDVDAFFMKPEFVSSITPADGSPPWRIG